MKNNVLRRFRELSMSRSDCATYLCPSGACGEEKHRAALRDEDPGQTGSSPDQQAPSLSSEQRAGSAIGRGQL